MPFKLVVTHAQASAPNTHVFDQDRVLIGREAEADLCLPDVKRVVSKEHAAVTRSGAALFVTDLNSKNFTYVNGERLKARQPHPIHPGDALTIGDYELVLETADAPAPAEKPPAYDDRTVFDASFVNPFEDGAQLLAAALRDIHKHYDQVAPSRRDDALYDAVRSALGDEGEAALHVVGRLVRAGGPGTEAEPSAPPVAAPPVTPSPPAVPPPEPAAPAPFLRDSDTFGASTAPLPAIDSPRTDRVLDAALRAAARLLPIPWQFRHEFIGQTIMQAEGTAFLYGGEAELKRHLLDPAASDEEAEERLRLFREAAAQVALHMVALLDGYRAGAQEGGRRLIDQLHPDALVNEAAQKNPLYRFVPPLAKAHALDLLRDQLQELRAEDWASAEQRAYRPAFIKAYLARMTAS